MDENEGAKHLGTKRTCCQGEGSDVACSRDGLSREEGSGILEDQPERTCCKPVLYSKTSQCDLRVQLIDVLWSITPHTTRLAGEES